MCLTMLRPLSYITANQVGGISYAVLPDIDQMDNKSASGQFNILGADL